MSDWVKFCVFLQQMKMRFLGVLIAAAIVEYAVSVEFLICNMKILLNPKTHSKPVLSRSAFWWVNHKFTLPKPTWNIKSAN